MHHDELNKKANFFHEHYDVYDGVMLDVYVQHQAFDADGQELPDDNGSYFPANVDDDEDTQVHEHKFKFDFYATYPEEETDKLALHWGVSGDKEGVWDKIQNIVDKSVFPPETKLMETAA
jgi:hypothetical protein